MIGRKMRVPTTLEKMLILAFTLGSLLTLGTAKIFARPPGGDNTPTVWVNPLQIPPGGEVTIKIRAAFSQTNVTKMEVTNPDGTTWSWTGKIELPDATDEVAITFWGGDEWVENDANGNIVLPDITWPAGANTTVEGEYTVYTYGYEITPSGSAKWDTSSYFEVPEFEVLTAIITALGFVGLSIRSRICRKS